MSIIHNEKKCPLYPFMCPSSLDIQSDWDSANFRGQTIPTTAHWDSYGLWHQSAGELKCLRCRFRYPLIHDFQGNWHPVSNGVSSILLTRSGDGHGSLYPGVGDNRCSEITF